MPKIWTSLKNRRFEVDLVVTSVSNKEINLKDGFSCKALIDFLRYPFLLKYYYKI
ncbi:hypothetical protein [Spiroplasma poulsonii]|uniref:hypothetical protein n=1 Tax=Spiroplasma poulsonii TaxID=2138 RepID=UPI0013000842|nr:hypothetical protein [Spiroplasma poulsonii]